MSDRDYLYGHVCRHGSLARSCQVCDLEDEVFDLEDEVRRLRAELQGMVAESSWDGLAEELTEVEADNARLRDAILSHMDASYDPSLVADMALWAHIMDQDATRACTDGPDGDVAARR